MTGIGEDGNSDIADLLGHKFKQYRNEDFDETAPKELYLVSAILIREGIIKLEHLYGHLVTKEHEQEIKLACALLDTCDIDHAKLVIYNLETLDDAITDRLCSIVHLAINDLYNRECRIGQEASKEQDIVKGTTFYLTYKPWRSGLPKWTVLTDILSQSTQEYIRLIGSGFSRDLLLFTKLLRLAKRHLIVLQKDNSPDKQVKVSTWIDTVRTALLPSITVGELNPGTADDVWEVLLSFPYEIRYKLYKEWRDSVYDPDKKVYKKRLETRKTIRQVMKRITSQNAKEKGREIGKTSHGDPVTVLAVVIEQIQWYQNMIPALVEASKYLTSLSYDVMTFLILEAFTNNKKQKMKETGENYEDWFKSK